MRITRIFTGDDGESHFEDLEVPLEAHPYGNISRFVSAKAVAFRVNHQNQTIDFHTAPRRQLVVNLFGSVEIETGLGEKRLLEAGDVLLADDLTGRGHISRDVSGPRRNIFIALPDDFDAAAWRVTSG